MAELPQGLKNQQPMSSEDPRVALCNCLLGWALEAWRGWEEAALADKSFDSSAA